MLAQFVAMLFCPFGRTEKALFFAVPGGVNDCALRAPATPGELSDRFRFFEHGYLTADGIGRAIHPRVIVIAADDPLLGAIGARQSRDDVAARHHVPVEFEIHVHARRSGAEVIGDRKRAAPIGRSDRTSEVAQQRKRVAVRNRQHRDLRDHVDIFSVEALRIRGRAHAGRERIAGMDRHIHHRSALRAVFVAVGAFRIDVSLVVAVVTRIGVDDAANRAVLGGDFRFDSAPRAAIARDGDFPFHVDAAAFELIVVCGHAVVDVDEIAGDIAIDRVRVVHRQLLVRLT